MSEGAAPDGLAPGAWVRVRAQEPDWGGRYGDVLGCVRADGGLLVDIAGSHAAAVVLRPEDLAAEVEVPRATWFRRRAERAVADAERAADAARRDLRAAWVAEIRARPPLAAASTLAAARAALAGLLGVPAWEVDPEHPEAGFAGWESAERKGAVILAGGLSDPTHMALAVDAGRTVGPEHYFPFGAEGCPVLDAAAKDALAWLAQRGAFFPTPAAP